MSADHHVFHDPTGRRGKIVKFVLILIILGVIASVLYAQRLFHHIPELPIIGALQDTAYELESEKIKKLMTNFSYNFSKIIFY